MTQPRTRTPLPWARVGIEALSIMASVLVAFAVDDWRERRGNRQRAEEGMALLRTEMTTNAAHLRQRIGYYRAMRDSLDAMRRRGVTSLRETMPGGFNGINPPVLSDAAYQAATSSDIFAHAGLPRVRRVAAAYSFQRFYLTFWDKAIDRMISTRFEDIGGLRSLFGDALGIGGELLAMYDLTATELTLSPDSLSRLDLRGVAPK